MDIFGKKRIAELEKELSNITACYRNETNEINRLEASEYQLMTKIREMDQLIFAMSQCTSWEQMQPIFAKLKTFTDARMIDESNRIKQVLIPEMQKTYRS